MLQEKTDRRPCDYPRETISPGRLIAQHYVYDPCGVAAELLTELDNSGLACEYATELDELEIALNRVSIDTLVFISDLGDDSQRHELEYLTDLLGSERVRVFPGGPTPYAFAQRHNWLILESVAELRHWCEDRARVSGPSSLLSHIARTPVKPLGAQARTSLTRKLIGRIRQLSAENQHLREQNESLQRELAKPDRGRMAG